MLGGDSSARVASGGADHQCFTGGFDNFTGDRPKIVDPEDAGYLGEEPFDEPEVAVGDAAHGGDCRTTAAVGARYVLPAAGPPCFLDDELFHLNDLHRDDTNVFPDQRVFLDEPKERGTDAGRLLLPGSRPTWPNPAARFGTGHPDPHLERIFTDKVGYLRGYAAQARPRIEAERAGRPRPGLDILAELKAWFEPLLAAAPHLRAGVGGPVLFEVGDQSLVMYFPAGQVRAWAGERCRYRFKVARPLVEHLIGTGETDRVHSLFLSCRFSACRVGRYNEHLYTFFKCLSAKRLGYVERWYAEQNDPGPEVPLGDWLVQRHCPHLRSDLTRSAKSTMTASSPVTPTAGGSTWPRAGA